MEFKTLASLYLNLAAVRHTIPKSSPIVFQAVALREEFRGLDRDVEGSAKQWRRWAESECPEKEKLPQEWKKKSLIQKLIILRALRPDRMIYALRWGQLARSEIHVSPEEPWTQGPGGGIHSPC